MRFGLPGCLGEYEALLYGHEMIHHLTQEHSYASLENSLFQTHRRESPTGGTRLEVSHAITA